MDLSDAFTGRLKNEVPQALTAFADALEKHEKLQELSLSDNALGPPGALAVSGLLSKAVSLQRLHMNNNGLGWHGGRTIGQALVALAARCDAIMHDASTHDASTHETSMPDDEATKKKERLGLRVMIFGRNRLENEGAIELAQALAAHAATLQEVAMFQNGIRGTGIASVAEALRSASQLRSIDLQDNTFVLTGSRAFGQAMRGWPHLAVLNLNDAFLTRRGCACILAGLRHLVADAKPQSVPLEALLLQYNGMRDEQLAELVALVPHLSHLRSLQLNGNRLDAAGDIVPQLLAALDRAGLVDVLDDFSDLEDQDATSTDDSDLDLDLQATHSDSEAEPKKALGSDDDEQSPDAVDNVDQLAASFSVLSHQRISELPSDLA